MTYIDLVINYHSEGFSAVQIHKKLTELFKEKTPAYSTITKKIRALSFSSNLDDKEKMAPSQIDFHIAMKISNHLECFPNSSVRFISSQVDVPPTTVYRYLTEVLNYKCVHLRWIPHQLTDSIRKQRIELSKSLLDTLVKNKKSNFKFFTTGDESWFCYEYFPNTQWIKDGDKVPDRVSRSLLTRKIMITIFWSKSGIQVLDVLDENLRMNSEYFIANVLVPLTQSQAYLNSKKQKKQFTLHMDNSRVHKSKLTLDFLHSHGITIAPHPAYSPDLALSDFFLFGALKGNSQYLEFKSPEEIVLHIQKKFSTFSDDMLNNAFLEWERRLRWVIENNGEYYKPT